MKVQLDDISLACDDVGSGPTVLLIHGFPLCRRMWQPQAKALAAAGYRVIAPDLRGFGDSAAPAGPYSMSVFADDLVGLLDHLQVERAVVGGMSMGGYVALNLLERHSERVAAAILVVTRAGADDDAGKAKRTRLAHGVAENGPREVIDTFAELVFAERTLTARPDLVAQVRGWMEMAHPHGLEGSLLAMRDRKDFTPDLPLLDFPALVIGAEEDRTIPLEQSRIIADRLPRATLCTIPRAGHMANLEEPEAFNRCLLDFLGALSLKS